MNYETILQRRCQIDAAVAQELGWICWQFHTGNSRIFPPSSGKCLRKGSHGKEVKGVWPTDAEIDRTNLMPHGRWSVNLHMAFELGEQGWDWGMYTQDGYLHMFVVTYPDVARRTWSTASASVKLSDFRTMVEAHATARCKVFLRVKGHTTTAPYRGFLAVSTLPSTTDQQAIPTLPFSSFTRVIV